jgi:hypothetical protein
VFDIRSPWDLVARVVGGKAVRRVFVFQDAVGLVPPRSAGRKRGPETSPLGKGSGWRGGPALGRVLGS